MKATKIAFGIVGVVLAVAVVAVVLVVTQVDRFVGNAVESYGRATTGTNVDVGGVDIALTQGRGELMGLTIGNPEGFTTDYALRLDRVQLALVLPSLSGDVLVIDEILVDAAHLNVEQHGDATNLTDIQRYMSRSAEAAPPAAEPDQEGRIIIDRFRLTNARVTLTSELLDEPETIVLDEVVVNGIGRDSGGATYTEATEAVLAPILAAGRGAAQERLRVAAAEAATEEVEEEVEEVEEDVRDRLRESLERE
jgi:uncharacterized protein involved in outer membrane biogenesis